MFINAGSLRRLIKEAWEYGNLICSREGGTLLIQGGYWIFYSDMNLINTKVLAAVVEYAGKLPEKGESFRAAKNCSLQYELTETIMWDAIRNFMLENTSNPCTITRLLTEMESGKITRLIIPHTGEPEMYNAMVPGIIDKKELIENSCEEAPTGPFMNNKWIYWTNFTGCFALLPYSVEDSHWSKEVIKHTKGLELGECRW